MTNDVTRPYNDHTQSNTYGPKHIGSPQHKKLAAGARCTVVVLYSAQLCCTMMVQCVGVGCSAQLCFRSQLISNTTNTIYTNTNTNTNTKSKHKQNTQTPDTNTVALSSALGLNSAQLCCRCRLPMLLKASFQALSSACRTGRGMDRGVGGTAIKAAGVRCG